MDMRTHSWRIILAIAAVALVATSLLFVAGCDEDDIERSLGNQTASAVERQYEIEDDPLLNEWISNMGHMIVAHSNRQQIPYEFKVIDSDQINAFAAPYGHIYFLRGLLDFADSEDEVWFVASHEVTHVVNRDSIKGVKKNILYSLGAVLIGGEDETMGDIAGLGAGLLLLHYSRDDERDADDGGCELCYACGYDPAGAIGFFDKLAAHHDRGRPSSLEHLLLTHPPTPDRKGRQLSRKYLDESNPEVQMHIARGYQRRSQYAHAAQLFDRALESDPDRVTARIGLADCYAAVGRLEKARKNYETALMDDSSNRYAARKLAALPKDPAQLPQLPAAVREQSRALLQTVRDSADEVSSMAGQSRSLSKTVTNQLSSAIQISKNNSSTILGLSDADPSLEDDQRETFLMGNSAVADANDAVYAVEGLERSAESIASHCELLKKELISTLQTAAEGEGEHNDVAIAERSWVALQRAAEEFDAAMQSAPAAIDKIRQAQNRAADTVSHMAMMAREPEDTWHELDVKAAAKETKSYAKAASAALGKSKRHARMAEARALLARINIAALGANPDLREVFDGIVAHYTLTRPEQVRELREQGFGHGDAAFALAGAKTTGHPAAGYLPTLENHSLIDTLKNNGVNIDGPIVLLKYLANAMEREVEFAQTQAAG